MDSRAVELINLDLDGRLDAAGRAELDALLATDLAVRARHQQLRLVARALASAPAPELPLDFHDSVLRQAQLRQRSNRPVLRRYWRGGLALAASVLAAVVVLKVVQQPVETDQVSGTLAPATPSVTVTSVGDGLALSFDIPAGSPGELVIEFARDGRRIVIADVGPGRRTVQVTGAGEFSATLVRDGVVTPVTRRSP